MSTMLSYVRKPSEMKLPAPVYGATAKPLYTIHDELVSIYVLAELIRIPWRAPSAFKRHAGRPSAVTSQLNGTHGEATNEDDHDHIPWKNALQEWSVAQGLGTPFYSVFCSPSYNEAPSWTATIEVRGRRYVGQGTTKKEAETGAAYSACRGEGVVDFPFTPVRPANVRNQDGNPPARVAPGLAPIGTPAAAHQRPAAPVTAPPLPSGVRQVAPGPTPPPTLAPTAQGLAYADVARAAVELRDALRRAGEFGVNNFVAVTVTAEHAYSFAPDLRAAIRAEQRRRDLRSASQLNGTHGEATNEDDMATMSVSAISSFNANGVLHISANLFTTMNVGANTAVATLDTGLASDIDMSYSLLAGHAMFQGSVSSAGADVWESIEVGLLSGASTPLTYPNDLLTSATVIPQTTGTGYHSPTPFLPKFGKIPVSGTVQKLFWFVRGVATSGRLLSEIAGLKNLVVNITLNYDYGAVSAVIPGPWSVAARRPAATVTHYHPEVVHVGDVISSVVRRPAGAIGAIVLLATLPGAGTYLLADLAVRVISVAAGMVASRDVAGLTRTTLLLGQDAATAVAIWSGLLSPDAPLPVGRAITFVAQGAYNLYLGLGAPSGTVDTVVTVDSVLGNAGTGTVAITGPVTVQASDPLPVSPVSQVTVVSGTSPLWVTQVERVPRSAPVFRPQISGANGEWTGLDDVDYSQFRRDVVRLAVTQLAVPAEAVNAYCFLREFAPEEAGPVPARGFDPPRETSADASTVPDLHVARDGPAATRSTRGPQGLPRPTPKPERPATVEAAERTAKRRRVQDRLLTVLTTAEAFLVWIVIRRPTLSFARDLWQASSILDDDSCAFAFVERYVGAMDRATYRLELGSRIRWLADARMSPHWPMLCAHVAPRPPTAAQSGAASLNGTHGEATNEDDVVRAVEAAAHNGLMHALNGNATLPPEVVTLKTANDAPAWPALAKKAHGTKTFPVRDLQLATGLLGPGGPTASSFQDILAVPATYQDGAGVQQGTRFIAPPERLGIIRDARFLGNGNLQPVNVPLPLVHVLPVPAECPAPEPTAFAGDLAHNAASAGGIRQNVLSPSGFQNTDLFRLASVTPSMRSGDSYVPFFLKLHQLALGSLWNGPSAYVPTTDFAQPLDVFSTPVVPTVARMDPSLGLGTESCGWQAGAGEPVPFFPLGLDLPAWTDPGGNIHQATGTVSFHASMNSIPFEAWDNVLMVGAKTCMSADAANPMTGVALMLAGVAPAPLAFSNVQIDTANVVGNVEAQTMTAFSSLFTVPGSGNVYVLLPMRSQTGDPHAQGQANNCVLISPTWGPFANSGFAAGAPLNVSWDNNIIEYPLAGFIASHYAHLDIPTLESGIRHIAALHGREEDCAYAQQLAALLSVRYAPRVAVPPGAAPVWNEFHCLDYTLFDATRPASGVPGVNYPAPLAAPRGAHFTVRGFNPLWLCMREAQLINPGSQTPAKLPLSYTDPWALSSLVIHARRFAAASDLLYWYFGVSALFYNRAWTDATNPVLRSTIRSAYIGSSPTGDMRPKLAGVRAALFTNFTRGTLCVADSQDVYAAQCVPPGDFRGQPLTMYASARDGGGNQVDTIPGVLCDWWMWLTLTAVPRALLPLPGARSKICGVPLRPGPRGEPKSMVRWGVHSTVPLTTTRAMQTVGPDASPDCDDDEIRQSRWWMADRPAGVAKAAVYTLSGVLWQNGAGAPDQDALVCQFPSLVGGPQPKYDQFGSFPLACSYWMPRMTANGDQLVVMSITAQDTQDLTLSAGGARFPVVPSFLFPNASPTPATIFGSTVEAKFDLPGMDDLPPPGGGDGSAASPKPPSV